MEKDRISKLCAECGSETFLKKISSTFNAKGKQITIKGIEAYVCDNCKSKFNLSKGVRAA